MNAAVVIVGAGTGGAQAAIALRQVGFADPIVMVGEEAEPPYERPPLTKEYLTGEKSFERLLVRPEVFWNERGVRMLLGRRVTAVDSKARVVTFGDGGTLSYRALVWATGGEPRALRCPSHDLRGIHSIRSRSDVDCLKRELAGVTRIVIIGGGFVGLEAAAALRSMTKQVTLVESRDRVLARASAAALSTFIAHEHRVHGVNLLTSANVDRLEGESGAVTGVRLRTGETIPAELVIVGIGIDPAVEQLITAGAQGATAGVLVDAYCRTSLPDVYAIGDCAAHANRFAGGAIVRLESVQNATDQANVVARAIAGEPVPYDSVPWFWSNQYGLRLQTIGLSTGYEETVVRGHADSRSFSIVYFKSGRVIALDCVNAPRDYIQGRRLVLEQVRADASHLADATVPLRDLCA